jgi:ABC-2 type transport system permease protein
MAWLNPLTYFVDVIRMVVLRGSGVSDIAFHLVATAGFALFYNTWAIVNYRKTT